MYPSIDSCARLVSGVSYKNCLDGRLRTFAHQLGWAREVSLTPVYDEGECWEHFVSW
jgi:hypothetical protein